MDFKAVQGQFFDRPAVQKDMDAKTFRAFSRFGAFVRRRAQTSIRYRKESSRPGQPPSGHRTMQRTKTNKKGVTKTQSVSPLREFIFFAYDTQAKSVVIGPATFNAKAAPRAMRVLQEGGAQTVVAPNGRRKVANYRPRPFMVPAFDAEITKLPQHYKG